jgi:putative DNA primase/helicase
MDKKYSDFELEQILSEVKLAEHFIGDHQQNLRYCKQSRTFFVFDKVRWQPSTNNVQLRLMLKATIEKYLAEHMPCCANDEQKIQFQRFINRCSAGNSAKRILSNLEIFEDVHLSKEEFDTNARLLAVPNGTIDLTTGQLREPHRDDHISRMCRTQYVPAQKCPQFKQFVLDVAGGSEELATHILMILAYCLTGLSTEQKVYMFYGSGANGKSVLLEIIRETIGNELVVHADSKTLVKNGRSIREDIARFEGARLATCSEIGIQDTLDEPLIKGLSGGDQIVSRKLYQNSQEFQNCAKIIIATNILPNIEATDHGIERRLEVIPFNQTFTGDKMDKGLMAKLLKEKEGILALLVQYSKAFFEKGEIRPPEVVVEATENYIKSGNSVRCFLKECAEETSDSGSELTLRDMYQEYVDYCPQNGHKSSSIHDFSRLMKLLGREQRKSGSCRYWRGLKLKSIPIDPDKVPQLGVDTSNSLKIPSEPAIEESAAM